MVVLNIIGMVIICILLLIVLAIAFGIFLVIPYKYIDNRLDCIQASILPFLIFVINVAIVFFAFADTCTYFTNPSDFYIPTIYDFIYGCTVYLSIYIFTEICRYIEYESMYNIDKNNYIYVKKSNMYTDDGYFWYLDKVKVEEKNGKDIFKLKNHIPTLHGKDIYNDEYIECYITNIEYDSSYAKIEFKFLNPIGYNFSSDSKKKCY